MTVDIFGIGHHGGSAILTLSGHGGSVRSLAYSFDGRLLVSGSEDGTVRVWDVQTGEESLPPLRSGDGPVLSVDFARNNKWVSSGTEAGIVCVINVAPAQASQRRLSGHSAKVNCVMFSADSSRLVSASEDKTIRFWKPESGEQLRVVTGYSAPVNGVAFSSDGAILASISGNAIRVKDGITGVDVGAPLKFAGHDFVAFSPDGITIAGDTNNGVSLWHRKTRKRVAELNAGAKVVSAQFSPDGQSLVGVRGRGIRIWTLQANPANAPWVDIDGHSGDVRSATFSPDGQYIASASDDATIRICSAGSGQSTVEPLGALDSAVNSVAISRDGAFIVSGSGHFFRRKNHSVRVWNALNGEAMLPPLQGHKSDQECDHFAEQTADRISFRRLHRSNLGRPVGISG